MKPDSRPRIFAVVLACPDLTYREKCYLLAVTTLQPERVDGKTRTGSKGMDRNGRYSLHLDYIARGMGATIGSVRETRRSLMEKKWLDRIHEGTFGRPDAYQVLHDRAGAQDVRVGDFYTLTGTQKPNPYGEDEASVRGSENPTLVYRDGSKLSHARSRLETPRLPERSLLGWLPNEGMEEETQPNGSSTEVHRRAVPGWDREESA